MTQHKAPLAVWNAWHGMALAEYGTDTWAEAAADETTHLVTAGPQCQRGSRYHHVGKSIINQRDSTNGTPFPSVFPVRFLPLLGDAQVLASSRSSIDALGGWRAIGPSSGACVHLFPYVEERNKGPAVKKGRPGRPGEPSMHAVRRSL